MDQESLEKALDGISPAVKFLTATDSTNRVALEWAQQGAPEWSLVVADYQTAGRGRFDRRWFAPAGQCLLFSLVLRPDCHPEQAPLINLAAAVALSRAIGQEGLQARVKWPNDVLLDDHKAAGILSEGLPVQAAGGGSGRSLALVLGVGINVNVEEFPPGLAFPATSLRLQAGRPVDRVGLLKGFLEHLRALYVGFPQGVVEAYVPLCDVFGRRIRVQLEGEPVEGTAERIDSLGNLVLDRGRVVSAGDLVYPAGP